MIKLTKQFLTALSIATLFVGVGGTTTQAKTKWHKGTPKTLRGKYKTKQDSAGLMAIYKIRAKSTWYWASGMSVQKGYNVHYESLGNKHYIIRYDAHKIGNFNGGKKLEFSVTKVGKNIKVNGYNQKYYKY
ncbi:hypothetical protein [Levilactobacillus fujinensis]|uniref:Uncharacterized protein n=1 Tax=Levilactobacillus fujinensis TaxID=2486024 RepID=A0ABW1TET9_9LACO|nr:hypothetical protein [Levilactobacillus fujinensis]